MKILIIGGNRFFGRRLVNRLASSGHDLTILNRGNLSDQSEGKVRRLKFDRAFLGQLHKKELADSAHSRAISNSIMTDDFRQAQEVLLNEQWDVIYDQVCYEAHEAKGACDLFKNKTKKYIFLSSQSVYDLGSEIEESSFQTQSHHFESVADRFLNYSEAKRQCETTFARNASFDVVSVRFPMMVGIDDYTERFKFHVVRILKNLPIFFPNLEAKISLLDSKDGADFLFALKDTQFSGPINFASTLPLRLSDMVVEIENLAGKKMLLGSIDHPLARSPYGAEQNWWMSTKKANAMGFTARPITEWFKTLAQHYIQLEKEVS
jgi:nucleoside-diphosphate-sugar epimerase